MTDLIRMLQEKVWNWMDHATDTRPMTAQEKQEWEQRTRLENSYHRANLVAGICSSPTVPQVRDLLAHAAAVTKKAKSVTSFANSAQVLGDAGDKLVGAASALDEVAKGAAEVSGAVAAACEISDAVAVLKQWRLAIPGRAGVSDADAAKAFDELFGATAEYMAKMPFPANQYAQIFQAISKYSFFSNMRQLLDPENPKTEQGRTMRDVMATP